MIKSNKIFPDVSKVNEILKRQGGKKIVFTNGVFDLLHAGHIDLLKYAKNCGDCLIVGLNSDSSVRRLKGAHRPVFSLQERAEILNAIQYVDFIIPFDEDTPQELIHNLFRIDVLVKGGDYRDNLVVGKQEVERSGGRVVLFDFKSNISTSVIIDKIKSER